MKKVTKAVVLLCSLCISCAHWTIAQKNAYKEAFLSCMEAAGITAAGSEGSQVWSILDNGQSQGQIINSLEGLFVTAGAQALQDTVLCAVEAWAAAHPVASKVSAAQAAVRVFRARHSGKGAKKPQPKR